MVSPRGEDRAFAARHRPWRGTTWRVTALVTLDDGRIIELEQGFGSGGRSAATDKTTRKLLTGELGRDGAVDATTLLGLTRETALATLFVRQADVLRVLTDASALQEYLERAAATSTAESTADEALARIAAYTRERIGVMRAGGRGPLAVASRQLENARAALDEAEARFESYQQLLVRKHLTSTELSEAEGRLADVVDHERERERGERWLEIFAMERRLEQVGGLERELAAGPRTSGAGRTLVTEVMRALVTYDNRPPEPPELEGPAADALIRELGELPELPRGELEPSAEVTADLEAWRAQMQRLSAHDENRPTVPATTDLPAPTAELRRLADELEWQVPEIDRSLAEEIARRRAAVSSPQAQPIRVGTPGRSPSAMPARGAIAVGVLLAVLGAALVALGNLIMGAIAIVVGVVIGGVGSAVLMRRRRPQSAPVSQFPDSPATDVELTRLEARLMLQEESRAQAERRRELVLARIRELGLPMDASPLRQIAADAEVAITTHGRYAEWERRRAEIATALLSTADRLRAVLIAHGTELGPDDDLQQGFTLYVEVCRERRETANRVGRRAGLEAQLLSRRSAEAARDHDHVARADAERGLFAVAETVGCRPATPDELPAALRSWVGAEEAQEDARQQGARTGARLDQLLDGRTTDELQDQIARMVSGAGDRPSDDAPVLDDRSAELEQLEGRARGLRDKAAELAGQLEGAKYHLIDVSGATEAEARADAEVRRLKSLADDLDYASKILEAAQTKVHADIAPVLNATLRPWIPRITQGRYDDVRVNPATLELEVHESGGQFRSATLLSHGTTEQLFILLRLALAAHLTTTAESAPVVLDDVTVQSDAGRTAAMLGLLHELCQDRQVVLFSQEDEVLRWAEETLKPPSDRLIRLVSPGS